MINQFDGFANPILGVASSDNADNFHRISKLADLTTLKSVHIVNWPVFIWIMK